MIFASVAQSAEHRASNADRVGSLPITRSISAPQWLKDQMEAARRRPPPTAEKVRRQFKAVADCRGAQRDLEALIKQGIPIR